MKLIIATGIYPPDIGGPATYSKKIAEEFSKRWRDVKVLTFANLRECESESTRNFKVAQVSRNHNVFARYFLYTWKLIKLAKSADLIYAQGTVSEGLPAYLASKLTGKKYILKVVGDSAWERMRDTNIRMRANDTNNANKGKDKNLEIEKLKNCRIRKFIDLEKFQGMKGLPLKIIVLKWIERVVARNGEKVIVPSEYLKKIVMMWGVEEGKIKVIYNAVEEGEERREGNGQILKVEKGDIILSVGRLVAWKGFDMLIDLMPKLLAVNHNFKLVIVGDGPDYRRLKDKINFVNIKKDPSTAVGMTAENAVGMTATNIHRMTDNKIILTGKMEHNEVLQLMKEAKIFVLNSGYEGLSHSVIEAMQAGLPCAVSNVGGNPELIENEKTGLLFKYNNEGEIKNAIAWLWEDEALRERVVAGARVKIGQFSFERMIRETMEILNFIYENFNDFNR